MNRAPNQNVRQPGWARASAGASECELPSKAATAPATRTQNNDASLEEFAHQRTWHGTHRLTRRLAPLHRLRQASHRRYPERSNASCCRKTAREQSVGACQRKACDFASRVTQRACAAPCASPAAPQLPRPANWFCGAPLLNGASPWKPAQVSSSFKRSSGWRRAGKRTVWCGGSLWP